MFLCILKTFILTNVYTRKNLNISNNFQISVYVKPTNTEIIALENSCHPPENKRAASR